MKMLTASFQSVRGLAFAFPVLVCISGTLLIEPSAATAQGDADRQPPTTPDASALANQLSASDPAQRRRAARELGQLGPEAATAIPNLLRALGDQDRMVRLHAADAVGKIGERSDEVVKALMQTVGDPDPQIRLVAVESIRELVPNPAELVPLAAELLEQEDQMLASRAVETIIMRGEEAVPFLTEALKNDQAAYWACLAIEELGETASATAPQLQSLLSTTDDPSLKIQAILALASIGSEGQIAKAEILEALRSDADDSIKAAAVFAAGMLGMSEAQERLEAEQQSENELVAMLSTWALAKLEPADRARMEAAVKELVGGLRSEYATIRLAAVKGIDSLPLPADLAVSKLAESLDEEDPVVAFNVVDALARLGEPAAATAGEALAAPERRELAVQVLQRLGPAATEAVPQIVDALQEASGAFRENLQVALRRIGPDAAPAIDELIRSLEDPDQEVRTSALLALGSIGPSAAAAKGKLLESLDQHNDRFEQIVTAWATANIAPEDERVAEAVVPVLIDGLSFPNRLVQAEAAAALGHLGAGARPALDRLQELADAPDTADDVREHAAQAIEAIR